MRSRPFSFLARQRGFTLVELMIAITLGLIVLAGVIGVLLANRESYRTSEALGRMQENARFTFEVLGRSIRAAGGNPCGATKVANVLNYQSTYWWANWGNNNNAVRGYEANDPQFPQQVGSGVEQRVAGTDALILMSGALDEGVVITEQNPHSAEFKVNTTQHGLADGDIVMACDNDHAAIFQVTNVQNNVTIVHNTGEGSPGNCSKDLSFQNLSFPNNCNDKTCGNNDCYSFAGNGFLAKLSAEAWYIGNNSRGGRSLYRIYLARSGNNPTTTPEEVVPDVRDMQLAYLASGASNYELATSITDWGKVVAVRLEITTEAPDVKFNGTALTRTWATVVQIRNSQP
jgi:type IV pilus assembly protein PilW